MNLSRAGSGDLYARLPGEKQRRATEVQATGGHNQGSADYWRDQARAVKDRTGENRTAQGSAQAQVGFDWNQTNLADYW